MSNSNPTSGPSAPSTGAASSAPPTTKPTATPTTAPAQTQQPLLINKWHLRKVGATASKPCWICHKPSTSVLITPDSRDFFYICMGHVRDRAFALPDATEAELLKRRKQEAETKRLEAMLAKEKEERRKEKRKGKKGEDTKDGEKEKDESKTEEAKSKELDDKAAEPGTGEAQGNGDEEDIVRVYELTRSFYKQRVDRIRSAQQAKRDRERLRNPSTFPSVPSALPGPPAT